MTADSDNPFKPPETPPSGPWLSFRGILVILFVAYVVARVFYFIQIEMR
jgi:hypothetical protein